MAGTKSGGILASQTNKARHGEDFYKKIGSKGGSKTGLPKGFAVMERKKHIMLSTKGGQISRRTKKV